MQVHTYLDIKRNQVSGFFSEFKPHTNNSGKMNRKIKLKINHLSLSLYQKKANKISCYHEFLQVPHSLHFTHFHLYSPHLTKFVILHMPMPLSFSGDSVLKSQKKFY